jgi:TatD DNase family protein
MGYYLGITGPVTYKNAEVLRNVVRAVPLDCLLIETDGPFLSPQAKRGKRNEPAFVRFVAEKIAEVRDISLETVAEQTARNADRLFRWRD